LGEGVDAIDSDSLRLVVVARADVDLGPILRECVRPGEVRMISPSAALVYTHVENATIRDVVRPHVGDGSVIVVEFERWSAHGDVDAEWLLRRGH
jgi:hypothetical protein